MVPALLQQILCCPSCSQNLTSKSGQLYCAKCFIKYPMLNGIPWLFSAPEAALLDWQQKAQFQLVTMVAEIKQTEAAAQAVSSRLARTRLENMAQGLQHNLKILTDLLKPLISQGKISKDVSEAVKSQLPLNQKLMGYYTNLHRDWCWGEKEQKATHDFVNTLKRGTKWGRVLVLGAGSGRYAYDLALSGDAEAVVALDINPLLLLFGQQMALGKKIKFNEFPVAPQSISQVTVLGDCQAPQNAPATLLWLFADGMNPPFQAASFDTVVTPWFVDVIPLSLASMAAQINRLLKPAGQWVNFGPFGFLSAPLAQRLSAEEVIEVVQEQGFQVDQSKQTEVPYLQSPYSAQSRFETILGFCANKQKEVITPAPYRHYPPWLLDLNLPIEASERFSRFAFATYLQSEILSQIDNKKSIREMATGFAQKHQLAAQEAEAAILTLLRQIWDEGTSPQE